MNLIVVIGAVVFVSVFTGVLVGTMRRPGTGNNLTVADIQARLAREEDIDAITDRAAVAMPVSLRAASAAARARNAAEAARARGIARPIGY
ncbi:hypothetical protein [Nocardia arizonensis]|uniref:hypothetical protein n=1 Tax=Nocardia arizonensis TaxID=1141647 RepID=UPI0006D02044|nr:hypothetical protein [Nocardia arizonensis]